MEELEKFDFLVFNFYITCLKLHLLKWILFNITIYGLVFSC